MNVWIRLFSSVETGDGEGGGCLTMEVTSKLSIVIHRTEKSARDAAAKLGGIVLEVAANSLKGCSEFPDPHLSKSDSSHNVAASEDGKADTTAYVSVACDDVPHKIVFQSMSTGEFHDAPPKDDEYQDLMKFTPDGIAYLDALSDEVDLVFEQ